MICHMVAVPYDHYLRYDELTALLNSFAAEYPDLVEIGLIGKSHEGRDIWMATITDKATGTHDTKPAFWCDGNIHATEVSACTAVLTILAKAVTKQRELLKTHTLYLVPRLNPDGAEWALETPPRLIRSSTRPYPFDEDDHYGLEPKDLDGNGRILQMRVPDANGPWKISEEEPRLLKRRDPGERGGEYFRLLDEGVLHNYDGLTMRPHKRKQGLDMNRNWPNQWRQEHEQHGAGPFPTSEPEVRAAVEAIVQRPNICGAITFHTFSGVHLRPPSSKSEDDIPTEDLWTFQEIGKKGTEMTGYPAISVHKEFRYHPKEVITGVFDDWMYGHRGVYAWTTEIWSPQRQAGITDYKYIDWWREHPFEQDMQMLKWSDEKLGGRGYIDWFDFEHPQLGKVQLGGWDEQFAFRNPPVQFLEAEVGPLADWALWQASLSPRLALLKTVIEPLDGVTRVRVAVQNQGWLPTNVSKLAAESKLVRGVVAEISTAGDPSNWLISGLVRQEAGQLLGWNHVGAGGSFDSTEDVAVFEWIVRSGNQFEVTVKHERAGKLIIPIAS